MNTRTPTVLLAALVAGAFGTQALGDTVLSDNDEVRAIVAEMLADAETRSSMLQAGNAGHDGAFFLASPDGNFRLNIKGFTQFRYNVNFNDNNTAGDDFEPGFNAPRTVMFFKGHIFEPELTYQIRFGFARTDGVARLDDAFIGYKIDENWSLRIGQGLHSFDREWYHGDVKLQTIERSLVALAFGGVRTQGVNLQYRNDDFRFIGAFTDGLRSHNTDFTADPADWALTGRVEFKLDGGWKNVIGPVTSPRGSEYAAMIGGAIHFEQGPNTTGTDEQSLFAWTADAVFKGDGWNLFFTGTGYHTEDEAGVSGADFDEYGFVAQGGYYISDKSELYVRYTALIPDSDRAPADETFDALAFGLNHYFHGHAARFSIQGEYFFDKTTDTVIGNFGNTGGRNPTSSLFGVLPSDEEGQFTLTLQFQLLF